ncbi:MAG: monooxygenase [Trichoglossum hirsutum]|nr:MAG: monooxygenase [Trichoglossum hirsutum]
MAPSGVKASPWNRHVLIIGAGISGLTTAKTFLHNSPPGFFSSVTVFEKDSSLGGVWSSSHIYEGLTTNSPLLTFEIPDFKYPENVRTVGRHIPAQDVNSYLERYSECFDVKRCIQFGTKVERVEWEAESASWVVTGISGVDEGFQRRFGYVVVCTGLYHVGNNPLTASQTAGYTGQLFHSSEMGSPDAWKALAGEGRVVVAGAGKSALDLATLLAKKKGATKEKPVTLVYRRPHWLSPRKMLRGMVAFEKILFCRFVTAWQPFVNPPDLFHRIIAKSSIGKLNSRLIFRFVADDFIKSLHQQNLPQTIPNHPFAEALSGALHVEPEGYLNCVRDGRIRVVQGTIDRVEGRTVNASGVGGSMETLEADNVLLATGYKLALPFFSPETLGALGVIDAADPIPIDTSNLPRITLFRLIVPPKSIHSTHREGDGSIPARNIAFNGFAYSLLNPTVMHVTAHWIVDYFTGNIEIPGQEAVEQDTANFYSWQKGTFGHHGVKGVHIGPHATLYTDILLNDMNLRTGHARGGIPGPPRWLREWFRPMFPAVYEVLGAERRARDEEKKVNLIAKIVGILYELAGAVVMVPFIAWIIRHTE